MPDYRLEVDLRRRRAVTVDDPYRFLPTLGEIDLHLINEGRHELLWTVLGAHVHHYDAPHRRRHRHVVRGLGAAAPRACGSRATSTAGTAASTRCASSAVSGVWELFVPGVGSGARYKYVVLGADGEWREKADPMAFWAEVPAGARRSVVFESTYTWGDDDVDGRARAEAARTSEPMSVYEVHLGSWRRGRSLRRAAGRRAGRLRRRPRLHATSS